MVTRSFGTLLHKWDGNPLSVENWFVSRKLNGHSVIWDGGATRGMDLASLPFFNGKTPSTTRSTGLWTLGRARAGETTPNPMPINAPVWWLNQLPVGTALHGELWFEDDKNYVERFCNRKDIVGQAWKNLILAVFAVKPYSTFPQECKVYKTLTEQQELKDKNQVRLLAELDVPTTLKACDGVVHKVQQHRIKNVQAVSKIVDEAHTRGWEGLVFMSPEYVYENSRTRKCLKYKPVNEVDVYVKGYEDGKTGRLENVTCSLQVEFIWDESILSVHGGDESMIGKKINLVISKLSDHDIANIKTVYPVDSKIKIKYDYVTKNGVPTGASVYKGM